MDNDIREAAMTAYDKLTEAHPGLVVDFGDFFHGFVFGATWEIWQEIQAQQKRIVEAIEKLSKSEERKSET